jgi:3-methyl-2-oxobutanoate hydroxymethyltransferase
MSLTRLRLADLAGMKEQGRKIAMLTAYDFPTARAAEAAGVQMLLVGDSLGCVILGHENTRSVPLGLIIILSEAVRRGAPSVYLVGDMPYGPMTAGQDAVVEAAIRFRDEAGCDAVKIETRREDAELVAAIRAKGIEVIAHLGLRPQTIDTPDGYRAQARDPDGVHELVEDAQRLAGAGASMLLLEAVPNEASSAVVAAVDVPVIGCGAGPACDGHVVVTQDMLGMSLIRPPKFVPVLADLGRRMEAAMREYVQSIGSGRYPAPQHVYPMRKQPAGAPLAP